MNISKYKRHRFKQAFNYQVYSIPSVFYSHLYILSVVAIQSRIWHVINLQEPLAEPWEPDELPERLADALTTARIGKNKSPEVCKYTEILI